MHKPPVEPPIPLMQVRIAGIQAQQLTDEIRRWIENSEGWCGQQDDLCDDAKVSLKWSIDSAISRLQRFRQTLD
jgi:hypothetical protein